MNVKLNWAEIAMCAGVGVRRKVESLRTSLSPLHKFAGHVGFEIDIQGACGELAAAKSLGLYWDGSVGSFKKNDLAGWQVRTRISDRYRGLVLRENDRDEHNTILVTGGVPEFNIVGWINNGKGKKAAEKRVLQRGRPPVFLVPEESLRPVLLPEEPCGPKEDLPPVVARKQTQGRRKGSR